MVQLKAVSNATRGQLYFYANIGNSPFGEGITAAQVADALKGFGGVSNIDIYISSYGGSPFEAIAIYNLLLRHPARVSAFIDSIAASAASILAMAGDRIAMADNSILMIHQAAGEAFGTAEVMRQSADALDTITDLIIRTYADRRRLDIARVREWVMAETWFDSGAALDAGLVDEITAPSRIAAFIPAAARGLFKHVPEGLVRPAKDPRQDQRLTEIEAAMKRLSEIRSRPAPAVGRATTRNQEG